jgi:hypothetical protein
MLTDARTWTTLAYNVLMLPIGITYFVLAIVGVSVSFALIAAPIVNAVAALGGFGADTVFLHGDFHLEPHWMNSPFGLVLCLLIGIVLLTVTLHVSRAITRGHAVLAKSMLVLP